MTQARAKPKPTRGFQATKNGLRDAASAVPIPTHKAVYHQPFDNDNSSSSSSNDNHNHNQNQNHNHNHNDEKNTDSENTAVYYYQSYCVKGFTP